jgi:predicted nucleic-acid-binding protein
MQNKDDTKKEFYFSGDFITTFYYILTQKKKASPHDVIHAIDMLCDEVTPIYLAHSDFILAKKSFLHDTIFDDFEDLIILQSALRSECSIFLTNDKKLLTLQTFENLKLLPTKQS